MIVADVSIPSSWESGVRTPEAVAAAFDAGVSRVIESMAFIEQIVARFSSE